MILGAIRYVRYTFFCCKAQEAPDEGITASSTTTPVPFGATAASRPVSGKLHVPKRYAKCWGVGTTFWAFKVQCAHAIKGKYKSGRAGAVKVVSGVDGI